MICRAESPSAFVEEKIFKHLGVLLVGLLHDVGIDVGGGGHLGMAQPLGDADAVHPAVIEHGGHGVAEGVGVDVGQAVALAELAEPVGDAVGVHGAAVLLGEQEALVLVVGFEDGLLFLLPLAVLPQQLHGLGRHRDDATGFLSLGGTLVDTDVGRVQNIVADGEGVGVEIDLVPLEAQHLAPPRPGDQQ